MAMSDESLDDLGPSDLTDPEIEDTSNPIKFAIPRNKLIALYKLRITHLERQIAHYKLRNEEKKSRFNDKEDDFLGFGDNEVYILSAERQLDILKALHSHLIPDDIFVVTPQHLQNAGIWFQ